MTTMKKITVLLIASVFTLSSQSCRKEQDQQTSVTKEINVSLKTNESWSYQVPQTGDADDIIQITKQAMHSSESKISPIANSENTLFEYTPALNYTGTDLVQVTNVEGQHGHHNGNCGGRKHSETNYVFKITVTAPVAH
jgi:hypothetical protein